WGPIVTSNILNLGKDPSLTCGTVNTAEFLVTFFATGIFLFYVGVDCWRVVLGIIIGGVITAPFAAMVASIIYKRLLMIVVSLVIILTSGLNIYYSFNL